MSHPEAIRPVTTAASGIQNGSVVTLVFESAKNIQKRGPDVNQFETSGAMNIRTSGRFDDVRYYTGDTPN